MATSLTFTLPSHPNCTPLACGVGNDAFVKLKTASLGKSADGSGYLRAHITSVTKVSSASWTYIVEVDSAEIRPGQTLTASDVEPTLSCISGADAAILAKRINWQTFQIKAPSVGVAAGNYYLLRRHRGFKIHAIEAAIGAYSDSPVVTIQLAVTEPNLSTYSATGCPSIIITAPSLTARTTLAVPFEVDVQTGLRAEVAITGTYPAATGLELHLLTSELV